MNIAGLRVNWVTDSLPYILFYTKQNVFCLYAPLCAGVMVNAIVVKTRDPGAQLYRFFGLGRRETWLA